MKVSSLPRHTPSTGDAAGSPVPPGAGALSLDGTGEAQTYSYTQYRTAQGLLADEVHAVTRDRIGFLWVAADNGLARHDGRSFTAYQASLGSRYVRDLVRRPDGDLLIANDAGIFAVTPRTDTATVRRLIGARPRPTDSTVVYPNGVYAERFERARLPKLPTQVHDLRAQGDTLWVVGDRLVQAQIGAEGTLKNVRTHGTGGRRLTHMTAGPEGFLFGTRPTV
jgi:hypothetical protein